MIHIDVFHISNGISVAFFHQVKPKLNFSFAWIRIVIPLLHIDLITMGRTSCIVQTPIKEVQFAVVVSMRNMIMSMYAFKNLPIRGL